MTTTLTPSPRLLEMIASENFVSRPCSRRWARS
jgi:hypothetical protein